jgi:hypothetical protein
MDGNVQLNKCVTLHIFMLIFMGAFTLNVKSVLNENIGGIIGGNWIKWVIFYVKWMLA